MSGAVDCGARGMGGARRLYRERGKGGAVDWVGQGGWVG